MIFSWIHADFPSSIVHIFERFQVFYVTFTRFISVIIEFSWWNVILHMPYIHIYTCSTRICRHFNAHKSPGKWDRYINKLTTLCESCFTHERKKEKCFVTLKQNHISSQKKKLIFSSKKNYIFNKMELKICILKTKFREASILLPRA